MPKPFLSASQSAAVAFDYALTLMCRYEIMSPKEKAAFWAHAYNSPMSHSDVDSLKQFLEGSE